MPCGHPALLPVLQPGVAVLPVLLHQNEALFPGL